MEQARKTTLAALWSQRWLCGGTGGAQLVEFAVALPLLVVFVVGIFDFGGAFNAKQKAADAVRVGARYGASLPTSDLPIDISDSENPLSILTLRDLVDSSLVKAKLNDCGLASVTPTQDTTTPWVWTFKTSSGCAANLVLIVERGHVISTTIGGNTVKVICTRVALQYPYQWHFNSVITVLVPGTGYGKALLVSTDAIMPNQM